MALGPFMPHPLLSDCPEVIGHILLRFSIHRQRDREGETETKGVEAPVALMTKFTQVIESYLLKSCGRASARRAKK